MEKSGTVDPAEVAYYERLADTWWDASGPFWPLHRLNALRVGYLREQLCRHFHRNTQEPQPLEGVHVLDVGCGGGILSESMARLGANVTGIDVVERNIRIARLHAQQAGLAIDYRVTTAETMAGQGHRYDVVLNMEVVEHVADLATFMRACRNLVGNGGVMTIATINRTPLSWLVAIVGAEYILRWLPRGTHKWRRFRQPEELERLLPTENFEVIARTGVRVNPVTRQLHLTRFMGVNYMLIARRV